MMNRLRQRYGGRDAREGALVLALGVAVSGCSIEVHGNQQVVTEERRFDARNGVELVVRSYDGSIDVQGWDAEEVAVRIERSAPTRRAAEALEVRSSQEGNRIVIEAVNPSGNPFGSEGDVSFVVRAPRRIALEAHTTDGAIRAGGFDGIIRIDTGDGAVRAERLAGQVRVRTGDGSIGVQGADGAFDVESGDGTIDLSGRVDSLRVHTGDGRVFVDIADGSAVKSDWSVTTGDGAVTMRIPESLHADIEADSGDGQVRGDWPDERPRRDGENDDEGDSYRARVGNGGPVIRLRSGDGSIEVRRR